MRCWHPPTPMDEAGGWCRPVIIRGRLRPLATGTRGNAIVVRALSALRRLLGARRAPPVTATVLDLTEHWPTTRALLRDQLAWRVRSVEQLTVGSARLCRRHKSLQIAPLARVLDLPVPLEGPRSARLLLPVELIGKRPLLDFNVTVDSRPAYLVPRVATSELQAAHVVDLAQLDRVEISQNAIDFITSICEFTPSVWKRYARRRPFLPRTRTLNAYIRDALPFATDRYAIEKLRRHAEHISQVLTASLGEDASLWSSADQPMLAAAIYCQRSGAESPDDIRLALRELESAVSALADCTTPGTPSRALTTLATYGRRWQSFVVSEVPLDRPFLVTTQREEPLRLPWLRRTARQAVTLGDARSNHITLRTSDENVEIARSRLVGLKGGPSGIITGVRQSRERVALYTSEPDRADRATLAFRLRVPRSIGTVSALVAGVTWLTVLVGTQLLRSGRLTVADLGVLVIPTTFAASLLLTRERNSLARRLQWLSRLVIALGVVALWGTAAYAWLGGLLAVS